MIFAISEIIQQRSSIKFYMRTDVSAAAALKTKTD